MELVPNHDFPGLGAAVQCRAFITHMVKGVDTSALHRFAAEVIPLHYRWVFHDEVELRQVTLVNEAMSKIEEHGGFHPSRDYLVLNGDPIISSAITWAFAQRFDTISLLRYDRRAGGYFPFTLTSPAITGDRHVPVRNFAQASAKLRIAARVGGSGNSLS